MSQKVQPVRLKPETLREFQAYISKAEAEMEQTEHDTGLFLWADLVAERAQNVRQGKTIAELWSGSKPVEVTDGLIHDWIGASRISGATGEQTLRLLQDYNNHKNIYKPEVIDSKLLSHQGDHFQIYLRLLKKKIITVVLDTEHNVNYYFLGRGRWCCRSYTTRIAEVEHSGTAKEKVLSPDSGYGFLWRLHSYWRIQESEEAVQIECRAISLTRDVPKGLGWIVEPIVRKLPRESLIHTLDATRRALT